MEKRKLREVIVCSDSDDLKRRAAAEIAEQIGKALDSNRPFSIALSGGHTPRTLYRLLAKDYHDRIRWNIVHLFWSDERFVQYSSPLSNFGMARDELIARIPIPPENVHPMPTDFESPELAATKYQELLEKWFSAEWPKFDLVLLGVGTDGHSASLFPGSPVLSETQRWVAHVKATSEPPMRLTLTLPAINAARQIILLAAGREKAEIVKAVLADQDRGGKLYPASMVGGQAALIWLLDRDAAALL